MTPDLAARKVIVAAYLYYVLDAPTMSDGEYDRLSQVAADGWDGLHPDRQWALGDPESTRAGGSHIRFSSLAVSAAERRYAEHHRKWPERRPTDNEWKLREDGCRYVTAV